jgi:uncharacterized protein with HEPN domain
MLKLLVDIRDAASDIRAFTAGMDLPEYRMDAKCRAAVERKFEVIGEACTRLRDQFPESFGELLYGPQIIGFRNRLIHGYDNVDDSIVWDAVTRKLPDLEKEVLKLIQSSRDNTQVNPDSVTGRETTD